MNMAAFQDAAREYAAAGIVPLPISPNGKRPLVKQPDKFGRRAALQILPKFPDANLGFWCGRHNDLTVVDIDSTADAELQYALDRFGLTPVIVRTASGKHHAYYRHDGERRRIRPIPGHPIDILGEGGICVAPPSAWPAGGRYEFARGSLTDLSRLPTIRVGAVHNLEPGTAEKVRAINDNAVTTGRRNDTVFRLALALAHAVESQADLLIQTRKANAELSKPPLPDAEVQRAVGSAWRYKMSGRLMARGIDSTILVPTASIGRLLACGETDALAVLALLRKAHSSRAGKPFAASPKAMEQHQLIGSWNASRYRNAIRKLCELGELVRLKTGGKGQHDPAMYDFTLSNLGCGFGPQS
jgi:hypothetical protein